MLLTRQKRVPVRPGLNMASMVDIVFLLLIFFMCTSSFVMPEGSLPAQLPRSGVRADEDMLDPVRIQVNVAGEGVLITCDEQACGTDEQLLAMLKERRALADVPVIISGQGAVPFDAMVRALDACYQADLWKVAFSAKGFEP